MLFLPFLRRVGERWIRFFMAVTIGCSATTPSRVGEVLDQPEFLNACLRVRTVCDPEELLDACKEIERAIGRRHGGPRHGPRVIDIDLLLLGDLTHASERLRLPHPRVADRQFVLVPLLEIAPELVLPEGTRGADALYALGSGARVVRAGPPLEIGVPRHRSAPSAGHARP